VTTKGLSASTQSTRLTGRTLASQVFSQLFGYGSMPVVPALAQRQRRAAPQPSPWTRVEPSVTGARQDRSEIMDVLKPFLMLASLAFVAGFAGYLAVARMSYPVDAPTTAAFQAPISTSASADRNTLKQI
jgi:hypothetical protein